MLKYLFLVLLIFSSVSSLAMETLVKKPKDQAKGLIIIAPAKKYLMRERLFSELADKLYRQGFVVVRFNWSDDTLEIPALELERAARDIRNLTLKAQEVYGFGPEQTVLISKSFSTRALDNSISLAKTHILLTPNCSAEYPFQETYWNILNQQDINLKMIISVDDPYCHVDEIRKTLDFLGKPKLLATTQGDHNFVIPNIVMGGPTYMLQDRVVEYVKYLVKSMADTEI